LILLIIVCIISILAILIFILLDVFVLFIYLLMNVTNSLLSLLNVPLWVIVFHTNVMFTMIIALTNFVGVGKLSDYPLPKTHRTAFDRLLYI